MSSQSTEIENKPGVVPKENMAPAIENKTEAWFKLILLILMVLQNSSAVLLGRYARTSVPENELFNVNHLVVITEVGKLIFSSILEFVVTNGALLKSVKENVIDDPLGALKISVPALLYLIQNTLLYVALSNLAAPLFQVTYQGKLVTTAIVSVIMLDRKYTSRQWVCLVIISIGVAIVVLGERKEAEKQVDQNTQSIFVGLTSVTVACLCSALAGVYFEKVLKKATTNKDGVARPPVSMWMRNMQLAFFSIVIGVSQTIFVAGDTEKKPYFHGFNTSVWILVLLQAGGGMLVAAVIKYADNVLKGLATGVSVVVASAFSAIFFNVKLTEQFGFGSCMILVSVYYFSNNLPKCLNKAGKEKSIDMDPMLPK